MKERIERKIADIKSIIDDKQDEVGIFRIKLLTLNRELDALETEISDLEDEVIELESELENLED